MLHDPYLTWRDRSEFAALYPVISFMDEGAAIALCGEVESMCEYLAVLITDPDGYRVEAGKAGIDALVSEHTFMSALVEQLAEHDAPIPLAAIPHVEGFRDTLASEGIRRGLILHAGDVPGDRALAACVALQLAGAPSDM
jgi:hypothetical protein